MPRPSLVVHHARNGVVALNVLTAALRADPRTADVPIVFARDADAMVEAIQAAAGPVIAAWSFFSPESAEMTRTLADVRARAPRALHVAGGVHATAEPLDTLRSGWDLVALGEGERTIVDLVLAVANGRDPLSVRGMGRLDGGELCTSGRGEPVELDAYPAFNLPDRKFNAIEITRGCVYACAFCQTPFMFKARFRHRSVENVREHVRVMRREGLRYVRFVTPTSLSYGAGGTEPNLAAVEALLAACREEIGPEGRVFYGSFPSEVRPEHVTPEALTLLRKYVDNDNLVIGGQSGSQRVLDRTRRDHSVDDVVRASRLAIEHGFAVNVDFIFGLPDEDPTDREATLRLMETLTDLGARVHSHAFMPLPGTPLRDAPPGTIEPTVRRELERFEARGRAYGPWRAQLLVAERLSQRRRA
ncbi:MAG: TIGR04013 family B12-binding domain/radical SAM domain-containing protein [Deltaproteobacteria bacterium]|nr:TIGR04013 family B12-binding domain/radical SAM domain-containing protein [Deltaproteobacteria bacterium]